MAAQSTQALMMQFVNGYIVSQALRTVAEFEIADRLSGGPKTADELAALTGANAGAMHRVLRALSSIGVFEAREGRYHLTPLAEHLRKDSPESVWPAAMVLCNELYKVAHDLPTSVRTGEGGFSRVYGMDFFEYLSQNPSRGALFDSMMASLHGPETAAIVAAYDFSQMSRLVDVGGGNGDVLRAVLAANPKLQGVLFDLPEVTSRARARLANDPVAERVTFASGDFFKSVFAGGDGYVLRHIIHDWGDAESVQILDRCRSAMGARDQAAGDGGGHPGGQCAFARQMAGRGIPDCLEWQRANGGRLPPTPSTRRLQAQPGDSHEHAVEHHRGRFRLRKLAAARLRHAYARRIHPACGTMFSFFHLEHPTLPPQSEPRRRQQDIFS